MVEVVFGSFSGAVLKRSIGRGMKDWRRFVRDLQQLK
jgi:hypothetical protein